MGLYQRRWWNVRSDISFYVSIIFVCSFIAGTVAYKTSSSDYGIWLGIGTIVSVFVLCRFILELIARKRLQTDLDTLERRTNVVLNASSDEVLRELLRTSAQEVEQLIEEQNKLFCLRTADRPHPENSGEFEMLDRRLKKAQQKCRDLHFLLGTHKMNPPNSYQEAVKWGLPESQDEEEKQEPSFSGTI